MVVTHENGAEEATTTKGAKRRKAKEVEQQGEPAEVPARPPESAQTLEETSAEPSEAEAPKRKERGAKRKAAGAAMTLGELAERFLEHLKVQGKSHGTLFSYGMEIRVACKELGADTLIANLTPEQVQSFFESPKVTRLKTGRPKAKPSIDKTRRVLRLALHWAVEQRWLEKAPLPDSVESK